MPTQPVRILVAGLRFEVLTLHIKPRAAGERQERQGHVAILLSP